MHALLSYHQWHFLCTEVILHPTSISLSLSLFLSSRCLIHDIRILDLRTLLLILERGDPVPHFRVVDDVFDSQGRAVKRVIGVAEEMRPDGGAVDGCFRGGQDDGIFH